MTIDLTTLDAHETPSDDLRAAWTKYKLTDHAGFAQHPDIDVPDPEIPDNVFRVAGHIPRDQLVSSFRHLEGAWDESQTLGDSPIYFHPMLPGLLVLPSLIPPGIQKGLLDRLVHRDLSNPTHHTNLHLHYNLPYRADGDEDETSFFSYSPDADVRFTPKDPSVHKPLSIKQVLQRRLSWVTLGGQYDWANRVYPDLPPPKFPSDIAGFLQKLFPQTAAEAAIVNFYTPGDTMMMHRDVSEKTDKGLVSLSIGCDALFMIAPSDTGDVSGGNSDPACPKPYILLRLRSGDAIYMSEESRYAWHGVPKVLRGTCPDYLAEWPAEDGKFEEWRGWMRNKRINLNVRQME
ncbi:alkylated DNA repair protein AlkB [Xylariomycetidae sp. FL2044]|nr:alkylated DNA repair protein AlkB [Xylariomycetidae sp. FL2044]